MNNSLYLHIPFCHSICPYCDFCRQVYDEKTVDKYLNVLLTTIPEEDFNTIYLGGGTPSCLTIEQTTKLLEKLYNRTSGEYTIECNVEDINEEKLVLYKEYGINRMSLGVQSFDNEILEICKRSYSSEDAISATNLVSQYFDNYSIDLLYGFTYQSEKSFENDLAIAIKMNVPHISLYALTLNENSVWGRMRMIIVDEEKIVDFYELAHKKLAAKYEHYEISNFALNGHQAIHNLVYWNYKDFYGLGLGASGKKGNNRYSYTRVMTDYLEKQVLIEDITLSKDEEMFEYLMMNFRLSRGIDLSEFKELFSADFMDYYSEAIEKNNDCFAVSDNSIAIKKEYWLISNNILSEFL